ncbi:DUF1758 domain-containing protein [Trichonephila clavata]|uniref:DUF1758 domain-containing protein n=1 Tax=Trichonephila clavata TaxID=2740835 RepID=A0A8X6M3B4_TRICU|nr:DUF1758 domain-containing protein [Trichonephila clavata]
MLLEERSGKSDLLINTHMNCLLSISPLKSSHDLKSFRKFFDHCGIQIRSLETLGVTSDTYGKLLCPLLLKLLPSDLVLEYNKLNSEFVVQNLMDFLAKELNSREESERQQTGVRGNPRLGRNYDWGTSYNTPIASPSTSAELINQSRKGRSSVYCIFSSGDYLSSDCRGTVLNVFDQAEKSVNSIAMEVKSLLYIDNCATSVDSVVELNTLREESQKILRKAKFDLWERKNNFLPEKNCHGCFRNRRSKRGISFGSPMG